MPTNRIDIPDVKDSVVRSFGWATSEDSYGYDFQEGWTEEDAFEEALATLGYDESTENEYDGVFIAEMIKAEEGDDVPFDCDPKGWWKAVRPVWHEFSKRQDCTGQ